MRNEDFRIVQQNTFTRQSVMNKINSTNTNELQD